MKKETIITLPSFKEIKKLQRDADSPLDFTLTDYAAATGTTCLGCDSATGKLWGETWLRTVGHDDKMKTYHDPAKATRPLYQQAAVVETSVDKNLGVMPLIQNPEASGIATVQINDQEYLTINGAIPLYPQTDVTDGVLSQKLYDLKIQNKLPLVGEYTAPSDQLSLTNSLNNVIVAHRQQCFAYKGNFYTYCQVPQTLRKNGRFRLCQPLQAVKMDDGSILCARILFESPFDGVQQFIYQKGLQNLRAGDEMDVSQFALGRFLATHFMGDLVNSLEFTKQQTQVPVARKKSTFVLSGQMVGVHGLEPRTDRL